MSTSGAPLTKQRTTSPPAPVGHAVERRHELVVGVERHLGHAGVALAGAVEVDPALGGQHDQRALGRVADQLAAVVEAGVGAQRHRQERVVEVELEAALVRDLAGRGVALAADREPVAARAPPTPAPSSCSA